MGDTISVQDIDRTHRLPGKKPNGKSRPVIVKFVCYNTGNLIFKKKKGYRMKNWYNRKSYGQKNEKITNSKKRT